MCPANANPLRRSEGDSNTGTGGDNSNSDSKEGSEGSEGNNNKFRVISFGDSLSDVGTYGTPGLLALTTVGGGKFTVNSPTSKIWVETVAAALGSSLCPHEVGLTFPAAIAQVPSVINNNCFGYAQGGARVVATSPSPPPAIGTLTRPVSVQIQTFLAGNKGKFKNKDVVFVQAGGNDVTSQVAQLLATLQVTAPADIPATIQSAVTSVGLAGAQLGGLVNTQILAKGARKVVVVNLGDVSVTPTGSIFTVQQKAILNGMVVGFNGALAQTLAAGIASGNVILIDAYTILNSWVAAPASFGFTSASIPACNNAATGNNALFCTTATVLPNSANFVFADAAHLTPYANSVFASAVIQKLEQADIL